MTPEQRDHQEWLDYLQPVGLVVKPLALVAAQAILDRDVVALQNRFRELVGTDEPALRDLPTLFCDLFRWPRHTLLPGADVPDKVSTVLPGEEEDFRPTWVVKDLDGSTVLLLIQSVTAHDLDALPPVDAPGWRVSPQQRFERLLRETHIPIGLLSNDNALRLIYAPHGESTGHLTFPVRAMTEVMGRPILAALRMLFEAPRLFTLPADRRLPAILEASRKYQSDVSTRLSGQVVEALYELLRGLQAGNDRRGGKLLAPVLDSDPDQVYAGLLNVLLRLVFLLYAEDRGMMAAGELYGENYSVAGLFKQLREDVGRYPDTMEQRHGAWARLLVLFRLVHAGSDHPELHMPPRHGDLFNPDRFPFLEGRAPGEARQEGQALDVPMVPDGTVWRVLDKLLFLDGERLSYRALDVEQLGSVYESMMGFRLERATGRSIAVRAAKAHGAPATIDLEALLREPAAKRSEWLKERTDQALTGNALTALKAAHTPEDVVAALGKKVADKVTPRIVPPKAMVLQPSDARRRSGSHYTPRSLTLPIVETTLRPVLERLGPKPTPLQILSLKVADPAMGSGAFLVQACRHLADALVKAWHTHGADPRKPADADEVLYARRTVAQHCIYGVDVNPLAVGLAKLSLWLATLARDLPFTFLDHALKGGDSLVGLTRELIEGFHWKKPQPQNFWQAKLAERMRAAGRARVELLDIIDYSSYDLKRQKLDLNNEELTQPRLAGDLVIEAFFSAGKDKDRQGRLGLHASHLLARFGVPPNLDAYRDIQKAHEGLLQRVRPFHWQIEFPEVFERENPGFDVIVGNPPFAGKNTITNACGDGYIDWLKMLHEKSHGASDLVAHFFRRSFNILRSDGALGLIATNSIAQGDTRSTGLRWICKNGGMIFEATKRLKWPGVAAVVVSVVHIFKGSLQGKFSIDGQETDRITAFLFHSGGHDDPSRLAQNVDRSFQGSNVLGMGFTFDDEGGESASPLAEYNRLRGTDANPPNSDRLAAFIGGEELNNDPRQENRRYIINFGDMSLEEAKRWPDLLRIVEERVRPQRLQDNRATYKQQWWHYAEKRSELYRTIQNLRVSRVLANCQVSSNVAFAFLPPTWVYAHTLNVYPLYTYAAFSALQCRIHEVWARFLASSMKDDLRYTPSDCFETFPFPDDFDTDPRLEAAGEKYYTFRADLMVRRNEGLTRTYNRFHDPNERADDIAELRRLHTAMDAAVLDAYGWKDMQPTCDFFPEHADEDDTPEESGRQRRRRYRYRWPDEVRDMVLAKLLELNQQRVGG